MSTALNSQSETIKNSIIETAKKSKETIREIIDANSKSLDSALDINKKAVDSIKKNLTQKEIDDSITYTVKETFGKSVELAEDSIDSVINAYVKQVEWSVALNAKLIDSFKENYGSNPEKVLNLIYENFETSRQVTIKNTLEIIEYYNKHTNLAVNFNKKFADTIANQVEVLSHIQSKGLDKYKEWVSDWWKDVEKEVVTK
jgi:DNA-directed RNA polymerase beta' subunit